MSKEYDEQEIYLSLEVAEILGVSESTVQYWCEKGKYPDAKKIDGKWQVPKKYFKITLDYARKRNALEQKLNEYNN